MVWANADTAARHERRRQPAGSGSVIAACASYFGGEALREYLNQGQSNLVVQVVHLLPQSLHSAFGTAAVEVGVPVDAVQSDPGCFDVDHGDRQQGWRVPGAEQDGQDD